MKLFSLRRTPAKAPSEERAVKPPARPAAPKSAPPWPHRHPAEQALYDRDARVHGAEGCQRNVGRSEAMAAAALVCRTGRGRPR